MDYLFSNGGEGLARIRNKVASHGWIAELHGPSGAGKSTLLRTLRREAERLERRTVLWRCTMERRHLPWDWAWQLPPHPGIVFLDGGEALPSWQLRSLKLACRCRGLGLVATTHGPLNLGGAKIPVEPTPEEFIEVVRRLLEGSGQEQLSGRAAEILLEHGRNARSALFHLYNVFEVQEAETRAGNSPSALAPELI